LQPILFKNARSVDGVVSSGKDLSGISTVQCVEDGSTRWLKVADLIRNFR